MGMPCKVCDSDKKESIEEMILKGETNYYISSNLKDMGILINHASIGRHKKLHMVEHIEKINELATPKGNTKYDRIEIDKNDSIKTEKFFDNVKTDHEFIDIEKDFRAINTLSTRLVKNQLAIVLELQEQFMNGKCKYPHEQIKGLQSLEEMMIKFQNFSHTVLAELKLFFEDKLPEKQKLLAIQAEKAAFELAKSKELWYPKELYQQEFGEFFNGFRIWYDGIAGRVEHDMSPPIAFTVFLRRSLENYMCELLDKIHESKTIDSILENE